MNYQVSVIVPIYKVEKYIKRCAVALLEQSLKDVEFIFVDDCTPDRSFEILQQIIALYPNRYESIKIVRHKVNLGLASARNSGLKIATGMYIYHCDSDDWIEKNALELLHKKAQENMADIVWTDFYFSFSNKELLCKQNLNEDTISCIKNLMSEKMHGAIWNKLYKRQLFFDNQITFPDGRDMWEDIRTNILLFYHAKKVSYYPIAFYHYNQLNNNSIGKDISLKKLKDIIQNTDEIISFCKKQTEELFEKEFSLLKLAAKQNLLYTYDKLNFKKWRMLYPESNKDIMKATSLPYHIRLIGFIASHQLWFLIDLWIFLKRIKNKAIR